MQPHKLFLEIESALQCRWLLRAAWITQELLTAFEQEIGGVTLAPGSGGTFEIRAAGVCMWPREAQARLPDIKELNCLVRDAVAPGKDPGHTER